MILDRFHLALVLGVLVVGGCSSVSRDELRAQFPPPTTARVSAPSEATTTVPERVEPGTTRSVPPSTLSEALTGFLAVGGLPDLVISDPYGKPTGTFPTAGLTISQPTWSRDGTAVVATALGEPITTVAVRDGSVTLRPARRPYFFYSWSSDGQYIAALGPGPLGTALDILGPDGVPVTDDSLDTGSFYLAWDPDGGDDLVIHRDGALELVRDPADLATIEPLGEPGQSFLAPAWIPGTREVLIVDETPGGNRLVRLDVDTLASADLGPVDGSIGISVSPDGSSAVLAHAVGPSGGGDIPVGLVQNGVTAPTELVDLATGDRTPISDDLSVWAEWSPDGSKVALMQPSAELDGVGWVVWDGEALSFLGEFEPTLSFFRNYVLFAWQFTESSRIWSPSSDAIVYGAAVDGEDGIWIREIDGSEAVRVTDGDVAFWSPAG